MKDGFATLRRAWKKGDTIELHLPLVPRIVTANDKVEADRGLAAIELGPLVYCVEGADNGGQVDNLTMSENAKLSYEFKPDLLGGVNVVKVAAGGAEYTAVPYYAWGNRGNGPMRVWLGRGEAGAAE